MLIFSQKGLAFLATPKTGSTALEMALKSEADIHFKKRRKHINASKFRNQVAPFVKQAFGVDVAAIALMRDPVDQLRSWYKYRARPMRAGDPTSTAALSFDQFVEGILADDPPPFAQVGSQQGFLLDRDDALCVEHLFQYERLEILLERLTEIFGRDIVPPVKNVSPPREAPLSPELLSALRAHRAPEFALYDRLDAAGGQIGNL